MNQQKNCIKHKRESVPSKSLVSPQESFKNDKTVFSQRRKETGKSALVLCLKFHVSLIQSWLLSMIGLRGLVMNFLCNLARPSANVRPASSGDCWSDGTKPWEPSQLPKYLLHPCHHIWNSNTKNVWLSMTFHSSRVTFFKCSWAGRYHTTGTQALWGDFVDIQLQLKGHIAYALI